MERRKFIKSCCYSAIGVSILGVLPSSCNSLHYANFSLNQNKITIPKSEFLETKGNETIKRDFVLVKTEHLNFPISIHKKSNSEYISALLMCTHQGCELNISANVYTCPCHGSEFTAEGVVTEGPADENLQLFKTKTDDENIYIYLK